MSKLLRISTIILAFFATISITFAQTIAEGPKRSPAEYAALIKKGKLDISPASTFSDPYMLAHIWIDEAVPVNKYSKKEREWQKTLNAEMEDLIWAYSPIEDSEVYQNDNYSLSVEQRDIDNEPITPYTWKWIDFERDEADGSKTIANLKRPNWWIKQLGAEKVGNQVYLRISEQGISGNFIVKKIRPCQSDTRFMELKRKNDYVLRPITGKFEHKSYDVWEFEFDNGEVIGCTPTHPFYSEKRQAYIPVGDIEFGEPIKNKGGKTITLKSKKKKEGGETVYNLEIYRDHNFMVGKSGLLVHNSCFEALEKKLLELKLHPNPSENIKLINKIIKERLPKLSDNAGALLLEQKIISGEFDEIEGFIEFAKKLSSATDQNNIHRTVLQALDKTEDLIKGGVNKKLIRLDHEGDFFDVDLGIIKLPKTNPITYTKAYQFKTINEYNSPNTIKNAIQKGVDDGLKFANAETKILEVKIPKSQISKQDALNNPVIANEIQKASDLNIQVKLIEY